MLVPPLTIHYARKHLMIPSHFFTSLVLLCLVTVCAQANTSLTKDSSTNRAHTKISVKQHFVQFFATISATKAEGMKNTLRGQGFPAFINVLSKQKKMHYQVQIGPFLSRESARNARLKVIKQYPEFSFLNHAILKSAL